MVFSDKHKILTKKLCQLKAYNARQLRTEFANKGWMTSTINRLLKKFSDMGSVDRRQGSDRPRSARTNENMNQVNDMVLSHEDQPELTAQSVKCHRRQAFLSYLLSALYEGSAAEYFKRRRAQELTEANCTAGKLLLKKFFQSAANLIFFTDEKVFTVAAAVKKL